MSKIVWRWFLVLFQCVFTDVQNQVIFVTKNFGRNITRFNLNFFPSEVSFHEDEPLTFLVYDKVVPTKQVRFRFLDKLQLSFLVYFGLLFWHVTCRYEHTDTWDLSFSQQWMFALWYSGLWHRIVWYVVVRTFVTIYQTIQLQGILIVDAS